MLLPGFEYKSIHGDRTYKGHLLYAIRTTSDHFYVGKTEGKTDRPLHDYGKCVTKVRLGHLDRTKTKIYGRPVHKKLLELTDNGEEVHLVMIKTNTTDKTSLLKAERALLKSMIIEFGVDKCMNHQMVKSITKELLSA